MINLPNYSNPENRNMGVMPYFTGMHQREQDQALQANTINPMTGPVLSFPSETNPMQPLGQGMDSSGMFPAEASALPPVLEPQSAAPPPPMPAMPPQGPALSNPAQPQPQAPALSVPSQGATGNARGSSRMPNQKIGMHEAMMRMGGATMAASSQGALAGLGAMTDSYGQIQDYNRAREMEAFQIEEARRKAIADRQARAQTAAAKGFETDNEAVGIVRGAIAKLQSAQDMFTQDEDSSLTGYNWTAIASRLTGRTVGNEDEAKRLFLNEIRLDSVMQRVAETKGAISNAEMQLFASQAPTLDSNDVVWKSWLDRQLKLQQKILRRLQTGETIAPDAPLDNDLGGASGGPVTFDPATGKFSDEG